MQKLKVADLVHFFTHMHPLHPPMSELRPPSIWVAWGGGGGAAAVSNHARCQWQWFAKTISTGSGLYQKMASCPTVSWLANQKSANCINQEKVGRTVYIVSLFKRASLTRFSRAATDFNGYRAWVPAIPPDVYLFLKLLHTVHLAQQSVIPQFFWKGDWKLCIMYCIMYYALCIDVLNCFQNTLPFFSVKTILMFFGTVTLLE